MSSAGTTHHKLVGAALGHSVEVEDVSMRCGACGSLQTEALESEASLRAQMAAVVCLFCARVGCMARAAR